MSPRIDESAVVGAHTPAPNDDSARCLGVSVAGVSAGRLSGSAQAAGDLGAAMPNLPAWKTRRRLRRRWPGVSAGLSLGGARPARAGPHPPERADQGGPYVAQAGARHSRVPQLPIVQLAATAPKDLGACEEDGEELGRG
jgi:hypothetical protein